jgi:hypothetical protein
MIINALMNAFGVPELSCAICIRIIWQIAQDNSGTTIWSSIVRVATAILIDIRTLADQTAVQLLEFLGFAPKTM